MLSDQYAVQFQGGLSLMGVIWATPLAGHGGGRLREQQPQAGRSDDSLHGREVGDCGRAHRLGCKSISFDLDALRQVTQLL